MSMSFYIQVCTSSRATFLKSPSLGVKAAALIFLGNKLMYVRGEGQRRVGIDRVLQRITAGLEMLLEILVQQRQRCQEISNVLDFSNLEGIFFCTCSNFKVINYVEMCMYCRDVLHSFYFALTLYMPCRTSCSPKIDLG